MRKMILSIILILTVVFGTCGAALAAENQDEAAAEGLQSRGKITYQNGKDAVVIDSQDFYKLEERIDLFKQGVADQLNVMHTYFTTGDGASLKTDADVRIAHTEPSADTAVDPVSIDFGTLLEGVAASQFVPSDVTAYDYPAGTVLYINAEGVLTADGSEKGAEKTDITAATENNLSAGTAAWVDGHLILGTGEDNKSYRDKYSGKIKISFSTYAGDGYVNGDGAVQTLVVGFDENGEAKIFSLSNPVGGFPISKKNGSGRVSTHSYSVEKIEE